MLPHETQLLFTIPSLFNRIPPPFVLSCRIQNESDTIFLPPKPNLGPKVRIPECFWNICGKIEECMCIPVYGALEIIPVKPRKFQKAHPWPLPLTCSECNHHNPGFPSSGSERICQVFVLSRSTCKVHGSEYMEPMWRSKGKEYTLCLGWGTDRASPYTPLTAALSKAGLPGARSVLFCLQCPVASGCSWFWLSSLPVPWGPGWAWHSLAEVPCSRELLAHSSSIVLGNLS